jgi:hypothetical protein
MITRPEHKRAEQRNPYTPGTGEECRVARAEALCCQVRSPGAPGVVSSQDTWQQKTAMLVERGCAGSGFGYRN